MSETPSTMIPLGTKAFDFSLPDVRNNQLVNLQSIQSDLATVVMFICNHCPYVMHIHARLLEVVKKYQAKGVSFVAISSNDVAHYPADAPEKMRARALQYHYSFPYLYDESQAVARNYQAACTPDFFVFDKDLSCVYRGRFDGATPGNNQPVTGEELSAALDALLAGQAISEQQKPSIGCNIKWKK